MESSSANIHGSNNTGSNNGSIHHHHHHIVPPMPFSSNTAGVINNSNNNSNSTTTTTTSFSFHPFAGLSSHQNYQQNFCNPGNLQQNIKKPARKYTRRKIKEINKGSAIKPIKTKMNDLQGNDGYGKFEK